MMPSINFNPSIANLTALRGMGGMPHPIRPMGAPLPVAPMQQNAMPEMMPGMGNRIPSPITPVPPHIFPGMYGAPAMQQMPMNGLSNLQALRQLLAQRAF